MPHRQSAPHLILPFCSQAVFASKARPPALDASAVLVACQDQGAIGKTFFFFFFFDFLPV